MVGSGRLQRAIEAARHGKPVIICDAPDREGEGDFALPASACTEEIVRLLLRRGGGLLCLALRPLDAKRIGIAALESNKTDRFGTRFGMPISLNDGGSGVSFEARSSTIRAVADPRSGPDSFTWPGHVPTLIAQAGGLRVRCGHTEAVVTLLDLAGIDGPGVLCEILTEDGKIATRRELTSLAQELGLPVVDIDELREGLGSLADATEQVS